MHPSDFLNTSNNLFPTRTQHRHTHQITDRDDCRPGQSEKNDEEVKRERGVKVRRVQGGETEQQSRKGVERRPRMRVLVKEGVISRVGLEPEGKGAAEDTFANCLKDSSGNLLDRLLKQFRT